MKKNDFVDSVSYIILILVIIFGFIYITESFKPNCHYHTDNIDISGKCERIFFAIDEYDVEYYIMADYITNKLEENSEAIYKELNRLNETQREDFMNMIFNY